MNDEQRRELETLLSAVCDGTIESLQHDRLEQMLRADADCRRAYLQYMDMHARLTVHPNLSSGIPLPTQETVRRAAHARPTEAGQPVCNLPSPAHEDAVLQRAAEAAGLTPPTTAKRSTGRLSRFLLLMILLAISVGGWYWFEIHQQRRVPVIREVAGDVVIETRIGNLPAEASRRLKPGETLRTGDEDSRAVLEYSDGTLVTLNLRSTVHVAVRSRDHHLRLLTGTIEVDAAPQSPNDPLVFATDHARYVVVGTRFRLYREQAATRLELDEGTVRLERSADGESVDVAAGHVAVATSEVAPLVVEPLATGRAKLRAHLLKVGRDVAFSSDGRMVTSHWERGLKLWNPDDAEPLETHPAKLGRGDGLVLAKDFAATISRDPQRGITLLRRGDSQTTHISLPARNTRSRALSPDGHFAAQSDTDGTHVVEIDIASARHRKLITLPSKGKAWCLALSDSARFVAAGYWDGTVRVHRIDAAVAEQQVVWEEKLAHTPTEVAITSNGEWLAVFTHKDGLLLVNLRGGKQQQLWAAGGGAVSCIRFSPDDRKLIAGLNDRTARMWSVRDGHSLLVINTGYRPSGVAWLENQSLLATAGGDVQLWECKLP